MTEFLDVVDENDVVIGRETRSTIHERGLWHRGAHLFLFTSNGKLLIQKRSANRKQYASLLDCSVSEHVKAGETYLEAAQRGVREELSASGLDLEPVCTFRMVYGPNDNEVSALFQGRVEPAQVTFDPVEIESIAFVAIDELLKQMQDRPEDFCGWFMEILSWYVGRSTKLTLLREIPARRFYHKG